MILIAVVLIADLFGSIIAFWCWNNCRRNQTVHKKSGAISVLAMVVNGGIGRYLGKTIEYWMAPSVQPFIREALTPVPSRLGLFGMLLLGFSCLASCGFFLDVQLKKAEGQKGKNYLHFVLVFMLFLIFNSFQSVMFEPVFELAFSSTPRSDRTSVMSGPAVSWTASPASPRIDSWPDPAAAVPTMPSGQGGVWLKGGPLDVYTGPGRSYYKDGKAQVGTNDTVELLAYDNGWLLIEYNVNSGGRRRGYVPEDSIDYKKNDNRTQSIIRNDLPKARITATARVHLNCYDDLTMVRMPFYQIREGTEVEVLASTVFPAPRNEWAYVEYTSKEIRLRAFVPLSDLEF